VMTPATAASTTGQQHNFCSGQTLIGTRSLRQDGAHPGRLCKGNLARTCVNHERDSNRIIVQTHRYSLTAALVKSMIRGVRFTTTLECVCRDAQLTSAMATSVRATPGDRVSAELPSQARGSVYDRGHRNNAHQDRCKAGSRCAAAVPTGVCICWNGAIVRGGGSPVRLDPPRKRRLEIEGPWRGTRSPREDRPSEAGNGARWYRPILGAKP